MCWDERVRLCEGIGDEKKAVEGVAGGGVQGVEGEGEEDEEEGVDPCFLKAEVLPSAKVGAGFSSFGVWAHGF